MNRSSFTVDNLQNNYRELMQIFPNLCGFFSYLSRHAIIIESPVLEG